MKITKINSIKDYLKGSRIIAVGTTSIVFLMKDNRILKLFVETTRKKNVFFGLDMVDHFKQISKVGNDSYLVPEEVLVCGGKAVAYIRGYEKKKTLSRMPLSFRLEDLIEPYYELLEDTKKISDLGFRLHDLHTKNILFDGNFSVIDLDDGEPNMKLNKDDLFNYNMCDVNKVIINAIFGVLQGYIMNFYDSSLNYSYEECIFRDSSHFETFLSDLESKVKNDNPSVLSLRLKNFMLVNVLPDPKYQKRF